MLSRTGRWEQFLEVVKGDISGPERLYIPQRIDVPMFGVDVGAAKVTVAWFEGAVGDAKTLITPPEKGSQA